MIDNSQHSQLTLEQQIDNYNNFISSHRRDFLKLALGTTSTLGLASLGIFASNPALAKAAHAQEREIRVFAPGVNETTRIVYWIPGEGYIRESLKELSWALRDRRTNTSRLYDPHVLDQLFALRLQMEYQKPIHTLSGYRSPETNAMLRRTMRGVAKDSLHMRSRAIDIRMPGRNTSDIRRAAISLRAGGVGYYPRSNFVHVDSGSVRSWS